MQEVVASGAMPASYPRPILRSAVRMSRRPSAMLARSTTDQSRPLSSPESCIYSAVSGGPSAEQGSSPVAVTSAHNQHPAPSTTNMRPPPPSGTSLRPLIPWRSTVQEALKEPKVTRLVEKPMHSGASIAGTVYVTDEQRSFELGATPQQTLLPLDVIPHQSSSNDFTGGRQLSVRGCVHPI